MISPIHKNKTAIVLGTGPSLISQQKSIRESNAIIFGINNTFRDFDLDVWIACDESWHQLYGKISGSFEKWHWSRDICDRFGYNYIEGRWGNGPNRCSGLSLNPNYIEYGHSSSFQALNLAVLYGCNPIYLAGFDMKYEGKRHYFSGLSDEIGEYPKSLRKYSTFEGLIQCYETVSKQSGMPKIYNMTKDSALRCFEFKTL